MDKEYEIEELPIDSLSSICFSKTSDNTIFLTSNWANFLQHNQKVQPIFLRIFCEQKTLCYFLGFIVKKFGIKILGSPFEGWLTCDMGFINIDDVTYDVNTALLSLKKFCFKNKKCSYIQITDKKIKITDLNKDIKFELGKTLFIDNSFDLENVLEHFTKNGRRDVRASSRKGAYIKELAFDDYFIDQYYNQLIDVFDKQGLKPFYKKEKLIDIKNAFASKMEYIFACGAYIDIDEEPKCIGTVFSFGFKDWAYFIGAASYRHYQKYLPNEALFFEFVSHWNKRGVKNVDLVGVREYKMKYNPQIIETPIIYFQKIPFLHLAKSIYKKIYSMVRKK